MLQFYYHPLSPLARRVWIALLEKQLEFEPIVVDLPKGEQLKPSFLQLNPFHHVPVLVDGDLRIIESLAILDYLEQKYPQISLLPDNPQTFAKVKMAQMVTNSELGSQVIPFIVNDSDTVKAAKTRRHLKKICHFFSELLGNEHYFGGDRFTLGDVVAGNGLISLDRLGFELKEFPQIEAYCQRLMEREVWQQTQPTKERLQLWKEHVRALIEKKSRDK